MAEKTGASCPNFFGQTMHVGKDGSTNTEYILRLVGLAWQNFISKTVSARRRRVRRRVREWEHMRIALNWMLEAT